VLNTLVRARAIDSFYPRPVT